MLYGRLDSTTANQLWFDKLKEVIDRVQPDILCPDFKLDAVDEQQRLNFLAYYYNQADSWSGITGKCLDVNGAGTADGTAVQIWSCGGGANQLWSAYTDGTLRSMGKCLDAAGWGTANGTKVQTWACNGDSDQVWQPYECGYRNPASGRCLDVPGSSTADGTQLQLFPVRAPGEQDNCRSASTVPFALMSRQWTRKSKCASVEALFHTKKVR